MPRRVAMSAIGAVLCAPSDLAHPLPRRPSPSSPLILPVGDVFEACVLLMEEERHGSDRPVALLADNHLGLPLHRWVLELAVLTLRVHLLAEQEYDEVSVLLDGARFAQVGQHRATLLGAGALLDGAGELRQRNYRHAQLLRQAFEAARDLRHFLLTVLGARRPAHELEVVH